jgi:hypothetical protein
VFVGNGDDGLELMRGGLDLGIFDEGEAIDGGDVVEEDAGGERTEKMAWVESSRRKKKEKKNYECI